MVSGTKNNVKAKKTPTKTMKTTKVYGYKAFCGNKKTNNISQGLHNCTDDMIKEMTAKKKTGRIESIG